MAASSKSKRKPKRTNPSTPKRSPTPTVQEVENWDEKKLLQWIQQRNLNILQGDHLERFKGLHIDGEAFLLSNFEFFNKACLLPPVVSLKLTDLVDEVKRGGKFIPRT
jgi:hypothetical protein